MTLYLRPLSLLYGPDARRAIAAGQGGALGGSDFIAFTQAELIERDGAHVRRSVIPYAEARNHGERLALIESPRPDFAGLAMGRPKLMGIVNVTPDSFSDGGELATTVEAVAHGLGLAGEGADILDIGGESTRPGSDAVTADQEIARILPVIGALAKGGHCVSVDTRKPQVMRRTAAVGAAIINDVSALSYDSDSLKAAADVDLPVVIMHSQGDPKTMQVNPVYDDVTLDVFDMLAGRIAACEAAGIPRRLIAIDPGIGFGKTFRHNLTLLNELTLFHGLGAVLLVGLSRKAFTGALTAEKNAGQRVFGSVGGALHAALNGAQILRVHDVKGTRQALAVALAAADPESSGL
ncbi:dihydropteroate synthase [Nordella sp. HKS 07]|uniref:dihydropteroate synthase n=1 Tax=Nordella sp. HKS 07 TaxID=2712222 RepID=UPI0013E15E1B|nr:dihydropteroate synthase [Nordella sp. HKS 07]QIG46860.1 dihydropteroate synthase [Nordella sp. HKS 07]